MDIVERLVPKLLPHEKKAIERRGTESVDAYDIYLRYIALPPPDYVPREFIYQASPAWDDSSRRGFTCSRGPV